MTILLGIVGGMALLANFLMTSRRAAEASSKS
jgi:hypothetical protein